MPLFTMVDLETMGNGPDAAICSISAVKFDPDGSPNDDKVFYRHVSLASSQQCRIDAATVMWWLKQQEHARQALLNPADEDDIHSALFSFDYFYRGLFGDALASQGVWAAPSVFDIPILESAFKRSGVNVPWTVGEIHCWSTVRKLLKIPKSPNPEAHHALADARAQVVAFRQGWHMLKASHLLCP